MPWTRWTLRLSLASSLGSLCLLVWAAHSCLAAALFRDVGPVQKFTIVAPGPGEQAPAAQDNQIHIGPIVVDGRALRITEIERQGSWVESWGSLSHTEDDPARLSFSARTAVVPAALAPWLGRATILEGDSARVVDFYQARPRPTPILLDLPAWERPWWSWLPFVIVIGGACALVRPWRSPRRTEAWLAGVLVTVHATIAVTTPVQTYSDSLGYLPTFLSSLHDGRPHYFPPGYGLVQACVDKLPGFGLGVDMVLLQHGLMVATLLMLWRLLRDVLPWSCSILWLATVTWLAPTLFVPQMIMSEGIALFTMTATLCLAFRLAWGNGAYWTAGLAGCCLGIGTLSRVVPLAACGPSIVLLLMSVRPWRRSLRLGAILFGVAGLWILTPMVWFLSHGHPAQLSSGVGRHLYNRVVSEQKLLDAEGPVTKELQGLFPDKDLRSLYHWDLADKLYADRHPDPERVIAGAAKEALARHPLQYFFFTFPHAWRNLAADPSPYLLRAGGTPTYEATMEVEPPLGYSAAAAAWGQAVLAPFGRIWTVLCWLAVVGALVIPWLPHRRTLVALLWVPAGYILATSAVEYFLERYNVAITPLVAAAAMLPLAWLIGRFTRREGTALAAVNPTSASTGAGQLSDYRTHEP